MVAILCCSSTFDSLLSSSTSLKSTSSISLVRTLDWEASVFLLFAGFDGALEVSRGFLLGRLVEGMFGGEESAVRSTNSL